MGLSVWSLYVLCVCVGPLWVLGRLVTLTGVNVHVCELSLCGPAVD